MSIKFYWLLTGSNIVSRQREVHEAQLIFDSKLFNNVSSWKYYWRKLLLNGLVCEDISQSQACGKLMETLYQKRLSHVTPCHSTDSSLDAAGDFHRFGLLQRSP